MRYPYAIGASLYGLWCFVVVIFRCLYEIIISTLRAPCTRREDVPVVAYVDNAFNREIVNACPSLKCFRPMWWAMGPHAQTLATALKPEPAFEYCRQLFTLPADGVQVALDWKADVETMGPHTPLIVCLHGMGGCRQSVYMQQFTNAALLRGYRSVVYNRRGHGSASLLPPGNPSEAEADEENPRALPKIFPKHSNMDDMMAVVEHVHERYPDAPKFLIGFSCGANLAINYVAASGQQCRFLATASVSNGYNIWEGSTMLRKADPVSDGIAAQFLKGLLLKGRLGECQQLAQQSGVNIDFKAVMKSRSLQQLEGLLVVPAYGYKDVQEYYEEDSCHHKIKSVQSPLLCIGTKQDPLVAEEMMAVPLEAARENPHILTVVTKRGGHMGWVSSLKQDPWYLTLFFEYIAAVTAVRKKEGQAGSAGASSTDAGGVDAGSTDAAPSSCPTPGTDGMTKATSNEAHLGAAHGMQHPITSSKVHAGAPKEGHPFPSSKLPDGASEEVHPGAADGVQHPFPSSKVLAGDRKEGHPIPSSKLPDGASEDVHVGAADGMQHPFPSSKVLAGDRKEGHPIPSRKLPDGASEDVHSGAADGVPTAMVVNSSQHIELMVRTNGSVDDTAVAEIEAVAVLGTAKAEI